MMQILALDVGTSSVKAAILDVATVAPLGPVARASYTLDYPTADGAEIPAERLWSAVVSAAREAMVTKKGTGPLSSKGQSPFLHVVVERIQVGTAGQVEDNGGTMN
jgi:sugar (pentulose or hexulose) kinase